MAVFYKAAFYDRRADMRLETVASYANSLAYDGATPVFDDVWCTREALAAEVAEVRVELARQCNRAHERAKDGGDYWPERARELDADLARHDEWAAKVAAS